MEVDSVLDATGSDAYIDNADVEKDNDSLEDFLVGNLFVEARIARETLTRVGLDLACSLEKLANLNVLMMLVEMRESHSLTSEQALISTTSLTQALEFDLLAGILDSELREIDDFMPFVRIDISNIRKFISSHKHLGEAFLEMEVELENAEESQKQSTDAVSELMMQSANLHSTLSNFAGEENGKSHRVEFLNEKTDIRMQTSEQRRHVLRMLDKSLAAELDLVKKVEESRQTEEELKSLLCSSKQEVFFLEQEVALIRERLFEAENSAEVLMGGIKEILGRQQIINFYLNSPTGSEDSFRFKHYDSKEKLNSKDSFLHKLDDKLAVAEAELVSLKEKATSKEMRDMQKAIEELKITPLSADSWADVAEVNSERQRETNMKLNENLQSLCSEKVGSPDIEFTRSDFQLQSMLASVEESQEKQSMLYSTICCMQSLIEDLKSRVSKAESRAENAEDICNILSVYNSNLNGEMSFLRIRLEYLEVSLHQARDTTAEAAKEIGIRTNTIATLVMQLSLERERLCKQILSLTEENRILRQQDEARELAGHSFSTASCGKQSIGEENDFSATGIEGEPELEVADSATNLDTARNVRPRHLNFRHVLMAVAISASAALWFRLPQGSSA